MLSWPLINIPKTLILGVNDIADAEERKREYVRRCDEMLHNVYPAARAGDIKPIKEG